MAEDEKGKKEETVGEKMAEENKKEEGRGENKLYKIALGSTKLFVFLYMAIWVIFLAGFTRLEGLISTIGAVIVFAVCLIAVAMEELG